MNKNNFKLKSIINIIIFLTFVYTLIKILYCKEQSSKIEVILFFMTTIYMFILSLNNDKKTIKH